MNKKIILATALASVTLALAACGNAESSSNGASDGEQVTLTYTSWDPNEAKGLRVVADEFEKANPDIKINMETTPWDQYWTKLEAASTGGNMPDIVTMHSNESYKYMSNGMLMNLDEVVEENNIDMNNFTEGISDLYTYDDSLYAIPKDVTTIGLWYNKELFDEAGLSYPDETWTWDTLVENAKKLTNLDEGIYGFAAPNVGQDGYNSFVFQNEGKILNDDQTASDFTNPNTIEALKWWVDLSLKEKVSPTAEQFSENDPTSYLESGRVAMITQGSWMATQFRDNEYTNENIDVAVLPKGKTRATQINGLGWAVSANTEHPEEAKKFIAFLASEKANEIQAQEGTAIPAYKGLGEEWVKSFDGVFDVQSFVDMTEYGVLRPFSTQTIKVETNESETLVNVFNGEISVEEAAESIEKETNKILEAE
jgi:multiple sugar transport system substrate-binding protein